MLGQKIPFQLQNDFTVADFSVQYYGFRKTSFTGRDYVFIHLVQGSEMESGQTEAIHEAERAWVNSLYRWPRSLRLKVPNIISVFISESPFDEETISLSKKNARPWQGGEIHTVHFIELNGKFYFGPDTNTVKVRGSGQFTFKNIDPQNRALHFVKGLSKAVFNSLNQHL